MLNVDPGQTRVHRTAMDPRGSGAGGPGDECGHGDAPRGRSISPSRALKHARLQDIYTVRVCVRVRPGAMPCARGACGF